jgi:hypothetical protein
LNDERNDVLETRYWRLPTWQRTKRAYTGYEYDGVYINVDHHRKSTSTTVRLTSPRSQTAVLWAEPSNDTPQKDKIGCNQRGGRDDKCHSSALPVIKRQEEAIAILLTVGETACPSMGFDSTIIDRPSRQAQGDRRKLQSGKSTKVGSGLLVKCERLSKKLPLSAKDSSSIERKSLQVVKLKRARKVMAIHSVGT